MEVYRTDPVEDVAEYITVFQSTSKLEVYRTNLTLKRRSNTLKFQSTSKLEVYRTFGEKARAEARQHSFNPHQNWKFTEHIEVLSEIARVKMFQSTSKLEVYRTISRIAGTDANGGFNPHQNWKFTEHSLMNEVLLSHEVSIHIKIGSLQNKLMKDLSLIGADVSIHIKIGSLQNETDKTEEKPFLLFQSTSKLEVYRTGEENLPLEEDKEFQSTSKLEVYRTTQHRIL